MKLASDPMGTAEGRAMLDQLPAVYFAILKGARIEQQAGAGIRCSFELPVLGTRTTTAPTAREAIRAVLLELTDVLTRTSVDSWPEGWRSFVLPAYSSSLNESPAGGTKTERFQSKSRQFTIGVTMPARLKESLQSIADQQRVSFAEIARQLASAGFEDFDERSFSEASDELLSKFSAEAARWRALESEQIMVRLDPHLAVRLRATAKEHGKSASEFGVMCMAHGFVLQLVAIEQKVAPIRGAAVRKLAPQVGLRDHAALLSGILAGTITAPKKVLGRLSEILEAPQLVLTEFFKRSFASRAVPAFKAENVKPQVAHSPTSWEDAVKSSNVPANQTKELLQLDE